MNFNGLMTTFVVILFLMSPSEIFWDFSLYNAHPYSITYKLWSGGLNIFDILFCFILIIKSLTIRNIPYRVLKPLFTWIAINAIGVATLVSNGYSLTLYYDGMLFAARTVVFGLLIWFWIKEIGAISVMKVFTSSIVILAAISIVAQTLLGYSGTVDNRLNMLAMGPNIASDLAILSMTVMLYLSHNKKIAKSYFWISAIILLVFLPLAGSRRFIIYVLIFSTMHLYAIGAKRALVLSFAGLTILFIALSTQGIDLVFSGTSIERRIAETIDRYQTANTVDGRSEIYRAALDLLWNHPFGIGNSDWLIQEQLRPYGFTSHTHNIIAQFYLKYGPLSFLALAWVVFALLRSSRQSPHLLAIVAILALINTTGYPYWNQKALFVHLGLILTIIKIGEQWTDHKVSNQPDALNNQVVRRLPDGVS